MTINIGKLATSIMGALSRPKEDYTKITWAGVLESVNRITEITAKVITVLQAGDDLTIDFSTVDEGTDGNRSLDTERIVAEVVEEVLKTAKTEPVD